MTCLRDKTKDEPMKADARVPDWEIGSKYGLVPVSAVFDIMASCCHRMPLPLSLLAIVIVNVNVFRRIRTISPSDWRRRP